MISVCIATHNGEKYIKEQLDSILCQLSHEDEVVISDDGSTDSTLDIIKDYNDSRVKIYTMKHTRKGMTSHFYLAKNFENSLKHATGDIIFLADQDDVWYSNKVATCVSHLNSNQAVLHNLECVDANLNPLGQKWYNATLKFRPFNFFMLRGKHMGCALVFKRDLLKTILPFPRSLCIHDFWIGIISELKGGLRYVDEPLIFYRIHSGNISGSNQKKNAFVFKIYYRLYTMINFFIRISLK